MRFHNGASFKSPSSDENIPQFLGVFWGFFFFSAKLALVHKTQLIAPSHDGICFPKTQTILGLNLLGKMCQLFFKKPPQQQGILPMFLQFFLFFLIFFFGK